MSRNVLLDTRTATFIELIGNGRLYAVPPFQRDYAWEEEQWEDLWTDIVELIGDADQRHYLGTLVVENGDRTAQIIDGQQRLATLSILALSIIGRLEKLATDGIDPDANRERATALRGRFIGEKDPASLRVSPKLRLNHNDDAFLQDYLVVGRVPPNPRRLIESNKRLWECAKYFARVIEQQKALCADGAALARLLNDTMGRQLLFILITVDNDLNAYTVFETLNARGMELSATDLLKNYLFSRVRTVTDQRVIERQWREKLVGRVTPKRFPDFLRYHLLCEVPNVRRQRLFKLLRDRVRTGQDAFDLLNALEGRAELFAALNDEAHEYWIDLPAARPSIRALQLFGVQQLTPVLFAAWEKCSPEDFVRVLRLLVVLTFRHATVGRRNPNELEMPYHRAAKDLIEDRTTRVSAVFDRLREIYVPDDDFRADFERLQVPTGGARKRLARYILSELESDASGRACDFVTDPGTIEHVLPENPTMEWADEISEDRQSDAVYRIGNLTLLEPSLNRSIGNDLIAGKRTTYETSGYALTQALAEQAPEHWTLAAIDHRQKALAARAVHIWRFDP
jgi:hypothetical protein